MINSVYSTVQALLNKNSFGYISPSDFNLYAKQAQLEIFEGYFGDYNRQVNLENLRRSGSGYADLAKKKMEDIELFSTTNFLSRSANNLFDVPSLTTTGDSAYMFGKVVTYTQQLASGTNTSVTANRLVNASANFSSSTISAGDIVVNITDNTTARVVSVISTTQISLTADIFTATSKTYLILSARTPREAEKVPHDKVTLLNTSLYTNPTLTYPAYVMEGQLITLFPTSINSYGMVQAQYYRFPESPKWTYVTLNGGSPSFDQSQPDYVDFEVAQDEEVDLVIKICQYAGLSIREQQVVEFAKREQIESDQPKI